LKEAAGVADAMGRYGIRMGESRLWIGVIWIKQSIRAAKSLRERLVAIFPRAGRWLIGDLLHVSERKSACRA